MKKLSKGYVCLLLLLALFLALSLFFLALSVKLGPNVDPEFLKRETARLFLTPRA